MMKVVSRKLLSRMLFDVIAPAVTRFYQPKRLMASIAQIRWRYAGFEHSEGLRIADGFEPGSRIADLPITSGKRQFSAFGTHENVAVVSAPDPDNYDMSAVQTLT